MAAVVLSGVGASHSKSFYTAALLQQYLGFTKTVERLQGADVHCACLTAMAELILSGCTTSSDFLCESRDDNPHSNKAISRKAPMFAPDTMFTRHPSSLCNNFKEWILLR